MARTVSRLKAFSVLFFVSLFFFYEFGLNNLFNALEISLVSEFHFSPVEIGFLSSLYFYANIVFLLPAGLLLDRYSPKKLIIIAMLVCSLGVFITAFTSSFIMLALARLFMGMGGGFCFIGCIRVASNWYPDHRIALASGFIVSMGMLGGFSAQAPVAYLIHLYDWRTATVLVSLVGVLVTLLIYLFVQDQPAGAPVAKKTYSKEMVKTVKQVLKNPQNWLCGLYSSAINLPVFILGSLWGIPYLVHVYALSELDAAHVCGFIFIGSMVGALIVNAISNVLASRKLPMLIGAMLSFSLILYAVAFVKAPSMLELTVFFFMLGLVTSTQVLSYPTVIEMNPAALSSTATSIISISCLSGGAISAPLFGYLLTYFNKIETSPYKVVDPEAYQTAMYMLPISFAIAFIAVLFIRESFDIKRKNKRRS